MRLGLSLRTRAWLGLLAGAMAMLLFSCGGLGSSALPNPDDGNNPGAVDNGGSTGGTSSAFDANGNTSSFGIPMGMMGNITAGQAVWNGTCATCHGSDTKDGLNYSGLQSVLTVRAMSHLNMMNQQMADLVAYLNRASSGMMSGGR